MRKNMYRNIKGKKVHVNFLASQSRVRSVSNCTIPKVQEAVKQKGYGTWDIPEKGFKQFKSMMKKHTEWIYNKETHMTEKVHVASTFPTKKFDAYQKKLWNNLGKAAKMELYTQYKLKKWEMKHPKPCPNDDLFKDEFIPQWEHEKEEALIRIRDFVVSMFDKLPLTGRFKISETGTAQYQEEKIAELKDINGDCHRVNEMSKDSKLLKKAQETVNKVHAKRTNLVAGNLKDHKRQKGRMILPKAA
jgi:hypothetical protein